jgi:hypothetical protein
MVNDREKFGKRKTMANGEWRVASGELYEAHEFIRGN